LEFYYLFLDPVLYIYGPVTVESVSLLIKA